MLANTLSYMFPGISFLPGAGDCDLRDDGAGPYIAAWRRPEPQPTPAEITAATLPATKALRIEADRQECRRRLVDHYGDALEQGSRIGGFGYNAQAQANHATGVTATVAASNVARDQINLPATDTVAKVEAVLVAWPVLT